MTERNGRRLFTIRDAVEGDSPFLTEAASLFGHAQEGRSVSGWGIPGDAALIAVDANGQRIGAAWYRREQLPPGFPGRTHPGSREAFIGVSPASRQQGVATALLAALFDRAREDRMVDTLVALVEPKNSAAAALCKRCGFEEVSPGRWMLFVR